MALARGTGTSKFPLLAPQVPPALAEMPATGDGGTRDAVTRPTDTCPGFTVRNTDTDPNRERKPKPWAVRSFLKVVFSTCGHVFRLDALGHAIYLMTVR